MRAAAAGIVTARSRHRRGEALEVVILSTMLADRAGIGEWGFSALVVADGHRLLFDTGARPETVLQNARELKIDLSGVTNVILSHHHGDHTGGLVTLRRELAQRNPRALERAHVGAGIFLSRPGRAAVRPTRPWRSKRVRGAGWIVRGRRPADRVVSGRLADRTGSAHVSRANWSLKRTIRHPDGRQVEDNVPEDMSLVLDTDKGLVVVSGCGHAGIVNTLEYARRQVRETQVHAALGGFHLFEADAATLDWTAAKLRGSRSRTCSAPIAPGSRPCLDCGSGSVSPAPPAPSGPSVRGSTSRPVSIRVRSRDEVTASRPGPSTLSMKTAGWRPGARPGRAGRVVVRLIFV